MGVGSLLVATEETPKGFAASGLEEVPYTLFVGEHGYASSLIVAGLVAGLHARTKPA
jgi:hypothetical protein